MGATEATNAAVYAAGKLGRRPDAFITYGSPLPGADNFKNYYNQVVSCNRYPQNSGKTWPIHHGFQKW